MKHLSIGKKPGIFVLSLDTEIAWGTFDIGGLRLYRKHFNRYRDLVSELIALLDKYKIVATWAFVGHLLLERCERVNGITHAEVLRPKYSWYRFDWHQWDPGTDVHRDPWWYGPDIFDMVTSAQVNHEIGTHTFSHIIVDDPACTGDIFRSQLSACAKLHQRRGLPLRSIVFPRNRIAYLEILSEFGITSYRGRECRLDNRFWSKASGSGPLHILDRILPFPPATYALNELLEGPLVNLPASMILLSCDGFRRYIPMRIRVHQAQSGLLRAAARGELFHLWFHPFNLGSDPRLFQVLECIFQTACELRTKGRLEILTMQEAAVRVRQIVKYGSNRYTRNP